MLALKSSGHIRTSRNIRGFRSGKHATGVLLVHFDGARIEFEKERFALRETRRLWLAKQLSKRPALCR